MNRKLIGYWVCTGLFCGVLGFSGFAHFTHLDPMVESMTKLGYPLYFMSILGSAKLAGVVALLVPGHPLLKEWAYAGFTFNLMGATASHVFAGDPIGDSIAPAIVFSLCAASYLLRPEERRLSSAIALGKS
jgi:hypothetical protein